MSTKILQVYFVKAGKNCVAGITSDKRNTGLQRLQRNLEMSLRHSDSLLYENKAVLH